MSAATPRIFLVFAVIAFLAGVCALVIWWAEPAGATVRCLSPDDEAFERATPEELYTRGHLVEAAVRAQAMGTTDGRLLSAQSLLALAVVAPELIDIKAAIDFAEADLQAILAERPEDVYAQLQYIALLGLKGREMSPLRAHFSGVGSRARQRLNDLLAREPDNPYALNFSGLWHLELINRGGKRLAGLFYGADMEAGREQIARAVRLKPNDLPILFESGRALFAFDGGGEEGAELARLGRVYLQRAVNAPTRDAVEGALSARADAVVNGADYAAYNRLCPPFWLSPAQLTAFEG